MSTEYSSAFELVQNGETEPPVGAKYGCIHVAIDERNQRRALKVIMKQLNKFNFSYNAYLKKSKARNPFRYEKNPSVGYASLIFFSTDLIDASMAKKLARRIGTHINSGNVSSAYPVAPSFKRITERTSLSLKCRNPHLKGTSKLFEASPGDQDVSDDDIVS